MEYSFPCPEPGDKEGWRQWCRVYTIVAVVCVVIGVVFLIVR